MAQEYHEDEDNRASSEWVSRLTLPTIGTHGKTR